MRILVKTVSGKAMEMKVHAADTVMVLKIRIQTKIGLLWYRQRLIFAGRLLENKCTLADYQIQKGCSVFLVPMADGQEAWWNIYSACVNEIQHRSAFHGNFDDDLHKYFQEMEKFDLSLDQQVALQGIMSQVRSVPTHRRKGSYFKELDEGLSGAIRSYEDAVAAGSDIGPFVIHGDVPYLAFEDWYKRQEGAWRIAFQFLNAEGGIVLLYGDPSFLHEGIAQWFGQCLIEQATLLIHGRVSNLVSLMGSAQLRLPAGSIKEPDFCVQPRKSSHPIPPFVGEVAYANESLHVLKGELVQWTVDGAARIAYGVKVSRMRDGVEEGDTTKSSDSGAAKSKVKLRFLEAIQGHNFFNRDLDFSPDTCTRAGDVDFVVKFPLREIFTGVTQDERLLKGEVLFDLFELQVFILELLENNAVDFAWHPKEGKSDGSPLLKRSERSAIQEEEKQWF